MVGENSNEAAGERDGYTDILRDVLFGFFSVHKKEKKYMYRKGRGRISEMRGMSCYMSLSVN